MTKQQEHAEPATSAVARECEATPLRTGGAVDAEELAALRAENVALKSRIQELEQQQRIESSHPGMSSVDAVVHRAGLEAGLRTPLLRLMAEAAPVLLWRTSSDGESVYFNQAWLAFTGRRPSQELGFGWVASLHPEDATPVVGAFLAAFAAKTPFVRFAHQAGHYVPMLVRGAILRSSEGVVTRIAGTQTNLTERKKAEERLRRSHELLSLTGQVAKVGAGGWT